LLDVHAPDVLALQEVDAATAGRISFGIARVGAPDEHATFLVSRAPVSASESRRFACQGVFRDKGFAAATVAAPGFARPVRVINVHLDPFSPARRRAQAEEIVDRFGGSGEAHTVVLGDFNEDVVPDGAIPLLARRLGVRVRRAEQPSYDFLGVRRHLDWILASPGLEPAHYEVLPLRLSDHRPVLAALREVAPGPAAPHEIRES
jgi:endonuclease/exonuclease/phosphatase family metal-dependent hydrolase